MTEHRPSTFDERFAALDERVTNLRSSFTNLEASTARGFQQMDVSLDNLGRDIRSSQRTPWGTIYTGLGVLLTVLTAIGFLVYSPIQSTQADLKDAIKTLTASLDEKYVPRSEIQPLRDRAAQDREVLAVQLAGKLGTDVWSERTHAEDTAIADIVARLGRLENQAH